MRIKNLSQYPDTNLHFVIIPLADRVLLRETILKNFGTVSGFIKKHRAIVKTTFSKVLHGDTRICPENLQKIKTILGVL